MSEQQIYVVSYHDVTTKRHVPENGPLTVKNTFVSDYADYHKIGIAEDPQTRVSTMSSATPNELRLVTTIEADDAKTAEKHLHNIFRSRNHHREWFKLTAKGINSLEGLEHVQAENLKTLAHKRRRCDWDHDKGLYVMLMEERGGDE